MNKLISALASTALAFGLILSTQQTAVAAQPQCYGNSCIGKDPVEMGCDDGVTLKAIDVKGEGVLNIRYSKKCYSNWVRYSTYGGFTGNWYGSVNGLAGTAINHASVWIWKPGQGGPRGASNSSIGFPVATYWTEMVSADGEVCSSVDVYSDTNGPGDTAMTPGGADLAYHVQGPCAV